VNAPASSGRNSYLWAFGSQWTKRASGFARKTYPLPVHYEIDMKGTPTVPWNYTLNRVV